MRDLLELGWVGIRTRKTRAALSGLGIAIGIATMIAVVGIPASSEQQLMAEISALGTNVLRAGPVEQDPPVSLPEVSIAMARRVGTVSEVSAVANTHAVVRRSDRIPADEGSGLTVLAARPDLLKTLNGRLLSGRFIDGVTERYPGAVLGYEAATRLGITTATPAVTIMIQNRVFSVSGVLAPLPLAPDLDRSVLVGWATAKARLGFDGHPTVLYLRAAEISLGDVAAVLPATLSPESPGAVRVSRPSDALAAKRLTQKSFSGLFVGLAGVALLVGGIGVANTMFISVLERRKEIGLRRALGAAKRQILGQFLTESVLLSALGGLAGTLLGVVATFGYCLAQDLPPTIPPSILGAALGGALLVGVTAGTHPALRASKLPPTEALAAA